MLSTSYILGKGSSNIQNIRRPHLLLHENDKLEFINHKIKAWPSKLTQNFNIRVFEGHKQITHTSAGTTDITPLLTRIIPRYRN